MIMLTSNTALNRVGFCRYKIFTTISKCEHSLIFSFRNSKCGGMATHAGLAIELGITRKKSLSPQMEAILIWCQCRTREYDNVNIQDFTTSWADGLAFCALIHNFFPNAFDIRSLQTSSPADRRRNFELAFTTGEKFAGVPDFLTAEDMSGMVEERRIDPKMVFSYVQEVYRMCNEL